jgi:hypothetical protein
LCRAGARPRRCRGGVLEALPDAIAGYYYEALGERIEQRNQAREQQAENEEEARLKRRQQLLEAEYDYAQKFGDDVVTSSTPRRRRSAQRRCTTPSCPLTTSGSPLA